MSERPKRIRLSRQRGWRKPEGAILVARPTRWGNPFTIGGRNGLACVPGAMTGEGWEYEDRISAAGMRHDFFHPGYRVTRCEIRNLTRAEAVQLYNEQITGTRTHLRPQSALPDVPGIRWRDHLITIADIQHHLAGHDLACWCPLDEPCHADVLLEIANPV